LGHDLINNQRDNYVSKQLSQKEKQMKTIKLQSNEIRYYTLEVPDENYKKVLELFGMEKPMSGDIDTGAIKQYPVSFPVSEFFSEELHSLCECDITDESYSLKGVAFSLPTHDA
jgi:hypothetical protein